MCCVPEAAMQTKCIYVRIILTLHILVFDRSRPTQLNVLLYIVFAHITSPKRHGAKLCSIRTNNKMAYKGLEEGQHTPPPTRTFNTTGRVQNDTYVGTTTRYTNRQQVTHLDL